MSKDINKVVDKFITTDPKELVGKLDPKRLKGIDLQDNANIMIMDTIGRYVKDPDKALTQIVKIENKLGEYLDKFMDTPVGKAISKARGMVMEGLTALKDSGIIGPDGKINLDKVLEAGGKLLDGLGFPILDTIKNGIEKLKEFGDALGITDMINNVKDWFGNALDFFDALVPDFVKDIFKNLNWEAIFPNASEDIMDSLQDHMHGVVEALGGEWIWYDKGRKLYNYDTLAVLNPLTLKLLGGSINELSNIAPYATALRKHYNEVERSRRAMRRNDYYR